MLDFNSAKEQNTQRDKLSKLAELKEELDKEHNRYIAEKQDSENKISRTQREIEISKVEQPQRVEPSIIKEESATAHPEVSPVPEITPELLPAQETPVKEGIIRRIQAQMALHAVLAVSIFSGLFGLTMINIIAFIMYKKFRGKPVSPDMADAELEKIQAGLEELENRKSEVKEELSRLSKEKAEANKEMARIKQEKEEIESRLAVLKEELSAAEKSVEQLKSSNEDYEKSPGPSVRNKSLIIKKQEYHEAVLRLSKQAQNAQALTEEKEKERSLCSKQ